MHKRSLKLKNKHIMKYSKQYWSKAERNRFWGGYCKWRQFFPKTRFEHYMSFIAD